MEEIFQSREFSRLEALCNARKLSFVVALYKGGGGVHKPKKGPAFVMSDFFVYKIPEEWEKIEIRPTPKSSWVNPKPLPLLSLPLSQLSKKPAELKNNFLDIWDHFHGVLTDTYFCPKLYLTKMPRSLVERWMPAQVLPEGETLSCADLVVFSAFVQWLRAASAGAAVETDASQDKIRLGFVALILNLACTLYDVDPEVHCKGGKVRSIESKSGEKTPSSSKPQVKSPGQISCIATSKLQSLAAKAPGLSISSVSKAPSPKMVHTVIPTDIFEELDKIPNITVDSTTSKNGDDGDDIVEIIETPNKVPGHSKASEQSTDKTSPSTEVIELEPPEVCVTAVTSTKAEDSSDKKVGEVKKTKEERAAIEEGIRKAKQKAEEDAKKKKAERAAREEEIRKAKQKADEEAKKKKKARDEAQAAKDEEIRRAKKAAEEETKRKRMAMEEGIKQAKKVTEEEAKIKKARAEKLRAEQKKEDDVRNAVSESLGRLIQIVVKLMSKDDYNIFSRKVSKNLNNLDPNTTDVAALKKAIDTKREEIVADESQVFVHVKSVFDELKKYKKTGNSDNEAVKDNPKKTATDAPTKQVFRWMDGNDNPAEGDAPSIEIDNADEDVKSSDKKKEKKTLEDKENKPLIKDIGSKGINIDCEEEVMIVDVAMDEEDKQDEKVVSSHQNLNIKEKAEKARKEVQDAVDETMEFLVTKTEEAMKGKPNGKEQAVESMGTHKNIDYKNGASPTEITGKRKVGELDDLKDPVKKKICLTTLTSKVPDKTIEAKTSDPEPEPKPEKEIAMEGSSLSTTTSKANAKIEKPAKKMSQKHIDKLEAALKKCSKKIKEYEEKEVDWDNEAEEESNYLMTSRLKRRYMQIYSKIAEAKELSDSLDRRTDKRLKCQESRYPEINKKIEKFVNRTKQFPDFQDILKLVREANKELHLAEGEMHAEAESIFQTVGKKLKTRREVDDHEVMHSYLKESQNVDPATNDQSLEQRLQEQSELGKKNMAEYLDNFYKESVLKKSNVEMEDGQDEDVEDDEGEGRDEENDQDSEGGENEQDSEEEGESRSGSESECEDDANEGDVTNPQTAEVSVNGDDAKEKVREGQNSDEKVDSGVSGTCTEVPENPVEKCFADTSNIENEVPKETSNVKETAPSTV